MRGRDLVKKFLRSEWPCAVAIGRESLAAQQSCAVVIGRESLAARQSCAVVIGRESLAAQQSCAVVIGRESFAALHAVYALKGFYGVNGRARSSLLKMLCDEGDGVKSKWSVMEWSCGMELSDGV